MAFRLLHFFYLILVHFSICISNKKPFIFNLNVFSMTACNASPKTHLSKLSEKKMYFGYELRSKI